MEMIKNRGVSLIELLICLFILGLVCFFSLPLSSKDIQKAHFQRIERDILEALRQGQLRGLLKKERLILQPFLKSRGWSSGISLYKKKTDASLLSLVLIQAWAWDYPEITIKWLGFSAQDKIFFASDLKNALSSGHFEIKSTLFCKKIFINRLGHPRIETCIV